MVGENITIDMCDKSMGRYRFMRLALGMILMLIANICFYSMENIKIFILFSMIGAVLVGCDIVYINLRIIKIDTCVIWLILIYGMFTFNGICRLRVRDYNLDRILFTFVQNIMIYYGLKTTFKYAGLEKSIKCIFYPVALFSIVYMIMTEIAHIGVDSISGNRMGGYLSGNVNTTAENICVIAMFVAYIYVNKKEKASFILWCILTVLSFLTGSKAAILFFCVSIFYFISGINYKERVKMILITVVISIVSIYFMFNNKFLYDVLGRRIEDMIFQMFGIGNGSYSTSTEAREIMIMEGVSFFMDKPLFGGGEKYFASRTTTGYGYSHNNYIEILCNMGLVGFVVYYGPLVVTLIDGIRHGRKYKKFVCFVIYILVSRFCADLANVTYPELCVSYLPMISSFIFSDVVKDLRRSEISTLS